MCPQEPLTSPETAFTNVLRRRVVRVARADLLLVMKTLPVKAGE